jgi:hypothetical protein
MASTVSMLFWNAYVQRYIYIINIESKVARHASTHMYNPLNGGFFNDHFGFRHSHKFCLGGYKIGYRPEWISMECISLLVR